MRVRCGAGALESPRVRPPPIPPCHKRGGPKRAAIRATAKLWRKRPPWLYRPAFALERGLFLFPEEAEPPTLRQNLVS